MCVYYFMAHGNYRCRYNKLSLNLLFVVLIVVVVRSRCSLLAVRCSCHRSGLVSGSLGQDSYVHEGGMREV